MAVGIPSQLPQLPPLDARIPHWSLSELKERVCPFCGASRPPLLRRPDGLPVARCPNCECWYVQLVPPSERIFEFYSAYYQKHRPSDFSETAAARMKLRAPWDAVEDLRLQRLGVLLGGLKGKRVLDVGCGLGYFLLMARARGAEVFGTEITASAVDFARTRLAVPVFDCDLDSCFRQIGKVDAIVMSDLIEHPLEPLTMLQQAVDGLRRGGVLMLWTPNGGAAGDSVETATNWVGFRVDLEHMQYLSAATVVSLSNLLGCSVEHIESLGFPGLERIDQPPTQTRVPAWTLRDCAFGLPRSKLAVRFVSAVRAVRRIIRGMPELRNGDYHLFAAMRKRSSAGGRDAVASRRP